MNAPFDPTERRTPAVHALVFGADADLGGLARERAPYDGPFVDDLGRSYVTVRTTGYHAQLLAERWGFVAQGPRVRATPGRAAQALGPRGCATTTEYLMDYDDIVDELTTIASSHAHISLLNIGSSYENEDIVGIQFGPTSQISDPPTVFLLGAHHAREWISTGVLMGVTRWLHSIISAPLLSDVAVVVVPVTNPDGYTETRIGDRSWRGNRDLSCGFGSRGVDLNRNMTTTFGAGVGTGGCGAFDYPGTSLAPENVALESMFGGSFDHEIAAVVSYHAYGNYLLYPAGYKPSTDSDGPQCVLDTGEHRCFNADFTLYRSVFGDTNDNLWRDFSSDPIASGDGYRFFLDHAPTLVYPVSGDTGLGVNYSPSFPALSVTPELPSAQWWFAVECEPDPDEVIFWAIKSHLPVLQRIVSAAPGLVTTNIVDAWGPNHVGAFASGLWTREYTDGINDQTARARFTKSVWGPIDTGSLNGLIGTTPFAYSRGRPGVEYNLYLLDPGTAYDPLEIPCEIISSNTSNFVGADAADCEGVIDLCDPARLPANNFGLIDGTRGGSRDCWWEATSNAILDIPAGTPYHPNFDVTHCHVTFSMEWSGLSGEIEIERYTGSAWERVYAIGLGSPDISVYPSHEQLYSYAFESNGALPSASQAFRIRLDGSANYLRVFDPVTFCRFGALR